MLRAQTPTLAGLLLALTACGGSTVSEVERPAPPPSLTAPCDAPGRLPEAGLSQSDVEIYWGRDRRALRTCGGKHAALVADWISR